MPSCCCTTARAACHEPCSTAPEHSGRYVASCPQCSLRGAESEGGRGGACAAQVQLQRQQHETPGHLQGAREGAAGSEQAGTNLQQTHDGDVIYRVPNTTESQVQVDTLCCRSCAGLVCCASLWTFDHCPNISVGCTSCCTPCSSRKVRLSLVLAGISKTCMGA